MSTSPPAITTAGLTKHYPGVQALNDLTLEVPTGSIYGFLGPNGAGKTTALKLLAGLTRPTSGSATVAGIPVGAGPAYRRHIGFLGQEPRFYGWMTGRETIASASHAAAAGGVTSIVTMPDTDPIIDDIALVEHVLRAARDTATVNVYPAAAISKQLAGRDIEDCLFRKREISRSLETEHGLLFGHPHDGNRLDQMVRG